MKKKMWALILTGAMVFSFTGCSSAKDANAGNKGKSDGEIVIGLSVDQQFESRVGVTDAIKAEAGTRDYEVVELIADGDAQVQNSQIETLINQKVDAILVCAVDQNTIETALLKAKNAGIPVVAYDRDLPSSKAMNAYVGPDSISDGEMCGQAMGEALKDKGAVKVLELVGALNDQNGVDRSKGWTDKLLALNPDIQIIQVPTDWDSQKALEGTQNAFQSDSDIVGVYCGTDSFIPGVETVLNDKGLSALSGEDGHVFVNGVNGSKDGYTATVSGVADGFLVMDLEGTGKKAVELAATLIDGGDVDRVNLVPGIYYTHEDAKANKDKIWGAKGVE